jgi:dTDP-4-amino-4,6-dideoxygalactose transaminase
MVRDLDARGVGSGIYYPRLIWDYDAYRNHPQVTKSAAPTAAKVTDEVISLPVHTELSDSDVDVIVDAVRSVVERRR